MRRPLSLAVIVVALADAATAAPRRTFERYVLVASEGLRVHEVSVTSGDLGVNEGRLIVTHGITAPRTVSP